MSDSDLFKDLCLTHLTVSINVVTTKRLGVKQPGRIQLLLIQLENASAVINLLKYAKNLRFSTDSYVKNHVYVSPHLSSAERRNAYLKRQRHCTSAATQSSIGISQTSGRPGRPIDSQDHMDANDSTDVSDGTVPQSAVSNCVNAQPNDTPAGPSAGHSG